MRDELLEDNMFEDLDHARALIGAWSRRYDEEHPTARWAGSHPTNTHANGHNTTNNNQQPSKHPVHKTRPGQAHHLAAGPGIQDHAVFAPSDSDQVQALNLDKQITALAALCEREQQRVGTDTARGP